MLSASDCLKFDVEPASILVTFRLTFKIPAYEKLEINPAFFSFSDPH